MHPIMRKGMSSLAILMMAVGVLFVSSGFQKRTDVCVMDFTVLENDSVIVIKTSLSGSMGYIRDMKTEQVDETIHCSFYSAFGGLNSRIGSKNRFEIPIEDSSSEIYFDRGNGSGELVLEKDAATGVWVKSDPAF